MHLAVVSIAVAALAASLPVAQLPGEPPSPEPPSAEPDRCAFVERFEGPGTGWVGTNFPDLRLRGGTAASRERLTVEQGAPARPALPISAGGDREARFFESTVPGAQSFALAAEGSVFADGSIRAALAFGVASSFGTQSGGVMLRGLTTSPSGAESVHGYAAELLRGGTSPIGTLVLVRWAGGTVTPELELARATCDLGDEPGSFVLELEAEGTSLCARLWRVSGRGHGDTTPVQLSGGLGPHANELCASDGAISAGRAGLSAFTRATNSVLFDDVVVRPARSRGPGGGAATLGAVTPGREAPGAGFPFGLVRETWERLAAALRPSPGAGERE